MQKISDVLRENSSERLREFVRLANIWRKTVTKNMIEVTTPVKITNGNLLVLVHDNIWLTELNYMKEDIVERLQMTGLQVDSLTFKYRPARQRVEKLIPKPYDITEQETFYIEKFAAKIDNEELKDGFRKAMTAYFGRHTFEDFINGN